MDKVYVFDLDNTLIATDIANNLAYTEAINSVMKRKFVIDFVKRFTRSELNKLIPHLSQEQYEHIVALKEQVFGSYICKTTLNENLVDILKQLFEYGAHTILLTNSHSERATQLCSYYKISHYFAQSFYYEDCRGDKYSFLKSKGYNIESIILYENDDYSIQEAIGEGIHLENIIKVHFKNMEQFTILSRDSWCRSREGGGYEKCLHQDITAFYHQNYQGGHRRHSKNGTIENLICTFKNDVTTYTKDILCNAVWRLIDILKIDLPQILLRCNCENLRVCVVPRAKREQSYRSDQQYLRSTIKYVIERLQGFEDGTHDIIRHTDTLTTHRSRSGYGGEGESPYVGITKATCNISKDVRDKDILLIDDLYTKSVNIDEDCIQALLDSGARRVIFYSIGKTLLRQ